MSYNVTMYRIEGNDGKGIFRSSKTILILSDTSIIENHRFFNDPYGDGLDIRKKGLEWKCAYKSLSTLRELNTLKDLKFVISIGFRIYEIKSKEFQRGKDQFVFTERGIIEKIDITNQFI